MNRPIFGEQMNTVDKVEPTDQDIESPSVNADSDDYKTPVLANLIQETPTGSGIVPGGSVDGVIVDEAPLDEIISVQVPQAKAVDSEAGGGMNIESITALLNHEESENFRARWKEIQGRFVDEPRSSVQQADALVSEVIEKITEMFANEHSSLEGQWNQGNDVSTEELRMALQHYRSFFNRLVI